MPRVFNQKIKILYLMRIFLEQTDEEHPMSVKELIAYLNSLGISAERKTVYDDIETLRNFGMDILNPGGSTRPVFILPVGNLSFRS